MAENQILRGQKPGESKSIQCQRIPPAKLCRNFSSANGNSPRHDYLYRADGDFVFADQEGVFLWGAHQIERSSLWQPHSNRSHDFLSVDAQILQGPPKAVSIFTGFLPKMSCVTASPPAVSPRYEQSAFSLQPPGTIMFISRWVNTQVA